MIWRKPPRYSPIRPMGSRSGIREEFAIVADGILQLPQMLVSDILLAVHRIARKHPQTVLRNGITEAGELLFGLLQALREVFDPPFSPLLQALPAVKESCPDSAIVTRSRRNISVSLISL